MLTTILVLASLGQCSGGSCAMPSAGFGYQQFAAPQYSYAPPAPPQLYRLADSNGAFFTHTDPAYLQRWIAGRNASMAASRATVPKALPPAATSCPCVEATGFCPCAAKATKAASLPVTLPPPIVALGPPPPEPR